MGDSRLVCVTCPPHSPVAFVYDRVGNRRNPPPDPNWLVFDNADRLTRWPGCTLRERPVSASRSATHGPVPPGYDMTAHPTVWLQELKSARLNGR